jgi:hypothetical protein
VKENIFVGLAGSDEAEASIPKKNFNSALNHVSNQANSNLLF